MPTPMPTPRDPTLIEALLLEWARWLWILERYYPKGGVSLSCPALRDSAPTRYGMSYTRLESRLSDFLGPVGSSTSLYNRIHKHWMDGPMAHLSDSKEYHTPRQVEIRRRMYVFLYQEYLKLCASQPPPSPPSPPA